jgi:endonuclease YncB( thermonuclease family)
MKIGAVVLVLLSACAHAETLTGHVIGISSGDTLTVLADRQRTRVRIAGIDAPDMRQTFGQSSRRSLSRLVFQKDVRLECRSAGGSEPKVCKVWVQPSDCPTCGMTLDAGLAQIVTGMAWWLREHAKEQSEEDRGRYESAEIEARERHRGLWSDLHPVPPWEWRRQQEQPDSARH